ncbi:MAG: hypothetical protein ACRD1N_00255 [Terriglobia bacterium]
MKIARRLIILLAVVALAPALWATETAFWRVGTFSGFLTGTLEGVSVSMDGQLTLAPEMRAVFSPDETVALSVVADSHGNLYVGTGHEGKVFSLSSDHKGKMLFQAPEPEILALAVGPDGDLYVGSSPEGKIYRVTPQGQSSVFYNPKVKYIWSLTFDAEGRLYAGTGDRGQILRITRDGKGGVFFSSNQTHIMCLTFDRQGNLLAGSEPGGLIYRITPAGKAFVLYQASLPEIHALAVDSQGRIYAAALGNPAGPAVPGYYNPRTTPRLVSEPAATVTVVASAEDPSGDPAKTTPAQKRSPAPNREPSLNPNVSAGFGSPYQSFARGRGALIEILPNYSAQTLWRSNTESIFGLATRGSDVLFSTDDNGHIFDLSPSADGPRLTLLTETRESLPTRILTRGSNIFVATSNIAKLLQIEAQTGTTGAYESPVKDTQFISRWGEIAWRAQVPPGCTLQFYTRSGNSARPDNTWTDWSPAYDNPEGDPIVSVSARYIQWKAMFRGSGEATPALQEVTVSYLNQNLPPEIRSLSITDGSEKMNFAGTPLVTGGASVRVTPISALAAPGIESVGYEAGAAWPQQAEKRPVMISWQATDPNRDRLTYSLYLKSTDEREWHLLKDDLRQTTFSLQRDSLPDDEYQVRLVASDKASNPPALALQTDLVSAPFWIDNTPPEIAVLSQKLQGRNAVVRFQANSKAAPLRQAEVSSGEGRWRQIVSDDGIVDAPQETFTVTLHNLNPGEHVVMLKVVDTAGNLGVGKAVIEVP